MKSRASSAYTPQPEPLLLEDDPVDSKGDAEVSLLKKRTCKVSISLGCRSTELTTAKGVLDTGAGPNLVHVKMLPRRWEHLAKLHRTSR